MKDKLVINYCEEAFKLSYFDRAVKLVPRKFKILSKIDYFIYDMFSRIFTKRTLLSRYEEKINNLKNR